jgi:hypothetical protein
MGYEKKKWDKTELGATPLRQNKKYMEDGVLTSGLRLSLKPLGIAID